MNRKIVADLVQAKMDYIAGKRDELKIIKEKIDTWLNSIRCK